MGQSQRLQAASDKRQATSRKLQAASATKKTQWFNSMKLESMNTQQAWDLVGGLSKPSKMPGWAYGIPAKECKTGSKLRLVKGSTCYNCYALKGCYVFKVVQEAQYRRLASVKHELWTGAMALLINSKKSKVFRWHDSGDVQDEDHLNKIFAVCRLTPSVKHWLPTREAWVNTSCR